MNRAVTPTLMLIPAEMLGQILVLFLVLGGICMVVGAKRASSALITTAIALPFITVIVEALFNDLFAIIPAQHVQLVAWLLQGIIYFIIFGGLMGFLFGQYVWNQAKGHLLAEAIIGIFRLAFSWKFLMPLIGLSILFLWRSG
ncbi:hypothetical protein SAMN05421690_102438 [Nitrosomonas sp. Nm51]|uniref:hypothetical protein n=1 Tax=Nitrosomonas sp. Nm51 TaxID=133720 RepID=UPI0008CA2F16|nr:hypothetical protein [Nitrosomonas sp. Nm51]SER40719.1 hypothetical protein SAMN05421690_102438 [Nitrosomonas sp. Nm51]